MTHQGIPSGWNLTQYAKDFQVKDIQHHRNSYQAWWGQERRISSVVQNHTPSTAEFFVEGSETTGTVDQAGAKITAEFGFSDKFKVGFEASFSHSRPRQRE